MIFNIRFAHKKINHENQQIIHKASQGNQERQNHDAWQGTESFQRQGEASSPARKEAHGFLAYEERRYRPFFKLNIRTTNFTNIRIATKQK